MKNITGSLLALILLFCTTSVANSEKYEGPLGLKWGMTPEQAGAVIQERFTLISDGLKDGGTSYVQYYSGKFAGFQTEGIEISYVDSSYSGCVVFLKNDDIYPASKLWEDVVAKVKEKYGAPDLISDPYDIGIDIPGVNKYEVMDIGILNGSWEPKAAWEFDDGIKIVVMIMKGDIDEYNNRIMNVMWAFINMNLANKINISSDSDF